MADEKKPIEILFSDDSLSDLSEDFKSKATVIFENAVATQIAKEKNSIKEEFQLKLDEQRKEIESDYVDKIDSYLTYVAEEWMSNNELAVENGIQVEISENFLKGMKDLFTESYVEVPDNKVDIVSEITDELSKKSTALDEAIDSNIELKREIVEMKKTGIISRYVSGLADTQVDKLNDLVEMIEFEDDEQFNGRVKTIVETYFKPLSEEDKKKKDNDDKDSKKKEKTNETMRQYVDAISQSIL